MEQLDNNTIRQIELLAEKYFRGETSTEEEKILREVLVNTKCSTSIINEARAVLGLFATQRIAKRKTRKKVFSFRRILAYAAALAMISTVATTFFIYNSAEEPVNIAWVGGKVSTDEHVTLALLQEQFSDVAEAGENVKASITESLTDFNDALNTK